MKTQILMVHGGMTFKSRKDYLDYLRNKEISLENHKSWADTLQEELGSDFQVIKPKYPLKENANYEDWKIIFERYAGLLDKNIILIGSSLGGMFLAKYLSENNFPKKLLSAYLICPPFDDSLPGESLTGGFELKDDLSLMMKNCKNIKLMFSKDDDIVPISHAEKYREKLPEAKTIIYESKNGHFKIEEFPEIITMIKQDVRNP